MTAKNGIMTGLINKQDRLAMLQTLVEELNAEERCALSSMLSRKNGPLALLPLEVVIEITRYLPILDPWRLQLVCRQWHSILSSDQVLETSLTRRETHSPSDSARSPELVSNETIDAKVRRVQAMRSGKPASSTMFAFKHQEHRHFPLPQLHREFALKADHIAYIDMDSAGSNRVIIRNLVRGTVKILVGTARETICGIALTTTIVAFLNFQGKLYVHDLESVGLDTREVRLPSASVSAFAADESVCALALQAGERGMFMIALYDFVRGSLNAFTSSWSTITGEFCPRIHSPHTLLVNARQGFLDVFSGQSTFVLHVRSSLTGERMSASEWHGHSDLLNGDFQPTGDRGMYMFRTDAFRQWEDDNECKKTNEHVICRTALFFDSWTATLEERDHAIGVWDNYKADKRLDSTLWKDVVITCGLWCDNMNVLFSTVEEDSLPSIKDPKAASAAAGEDMGSKRTERCLTRVHPRGQLDLSQEYALRHPDTSRYWPNHDETDALYVNDSFVVAVGHTPRRSEDKRRRIHVFCFDEALRCQGFEEGALSLNIPVDGT